MDINKITGLIIDAAYNTHKELGPGLLENIYEKCLCYELELRGLKYQTQLTIPFKYKDSNLLLNYRLDILVEDLVIIELKAVEKILPLFEAQLLTYLKLSKKKIGLILNFNVPRMKDGIKRLIL